MKLTTLSILITSAVTAHSAYAIKSDGNLHDGAETTYTIDNSLVCGVTIGDSNLYTGESGLFIGTPSSSEKDTHAVQDIKFINNNGTGTVSVDVTLRLPDAVTGEAADPSNYKLVKYYQNGSYKQGEIQFTSATMTSSFETVDNSSNYASDGYAPVLYTDTLTEADLPYGNLEYSIIYDVSCN
jgi:DNA-binding cell septation regulator SpoVG